MGHFFHGWRRKFGLTTLAMALLFMGGWLRSLSDTDIFTLPIGKLPLGVLISTNGSLGCTWADYSEDRSLPDWDVSAGAIALSNCGFLFDFSESKRRWCGPIRLMGASFGTTTIVGISSTGSIEVPLILETDDELEIADEVVSADHQVLESDQQNSTADVVLTNGSEFCGFAVGSVTPTDEKPFALWAIPYWALVIPLTLLSAFLLLINPTMKKESV